MAPKSLTATERSEFLRLLADLTVDADTDDQVLSTFLPSPQHQRGLRRDVLVIRGDRGAGKTALFRLLQAARQGNIPLSEIVPGAPDGQRIDGYSEAGVVHPAADVLESFAAGHLQSGELVRAFWLGHLVARLYLEGVAKTVPPASFWSEYSAEPTVPVRWARAAHGALSDLYVWLDAHERSSSTTCFVVYDHLDKVGRTQRTVRERVAAELLGLWLSLSLRYEHIRGKVLLREDLFQSTLTAFADATKLESRSVRLEWAAGRLFGVLVRRMAAHESLRTWLTDVARVELTEHPRLGWMPTNENFDEPAQQAFGQALVGRYMGAGPGKGLSHRWIINHLQDAHQRVTPRSLFVLIRGAAELAVGQPKAVYRRLLAPIELQHALEKASTRRVNELIEDYPVVARLEGLRGMILLMSRADVRKALRGVSAGDGFGDDADAVFEELLRIGVLADRGAGRFDVPDVFRYGFGIKRKGGTRRVA